MKNAAYLMAAIPEPFTILGKPLRPFAVGHEILFQRFDNAFSIEHPRDPSYEDLIWAVFICSQKFEDVVAKLQDPSVLTDVKEWGDTCGPFNFLQKITLFRRYLSHNQEIPKLWPKPGARKLKTPWILGVKTVLRFECGMPELEALNAPLWNSLWEIVSFREASGMVDIWDGDTDANIAAGKELLEQIMSGKLDLEGSCRSN